MIKLVCPECQHENESERIYCHACGARLDRSALSRTKPKDEDPRAAHRRLKAMFDPQRARLRLVFFQVSKLILGALLTAAIIQMILPPDVPPRSKSAAFPAQIGLNLENATLSHGAAPLRYTEEQVNAYLAYSLKSKQAALSKLLQFERAIVAFDEGSVRVTTERSLAGYSLFFSSTYGVSSQDGKLDASVRGGHIGRMPVHPEVKKYGNALFADLWTALDRERKSIAKLAALEFHPQLVIFTPRA
ncbi:MAG: zinc ribbon domain-containing protein [Chthoniobacterales bacterium]|nr:zinc ribbon domain-containing protein [Chthoniobacterales bacterium]